MTGVLTAWASRWGVPDEALADLIATIAPSDTQTGSLGPPQTEAYAQSVVRLEAPRYGVWLGRNNVGVLKDVNGRPVRYGLANESPAMNARMKSADLIGIKPVTITAVHVGTVIGQFVSRECKRPGWSWRGDAHEQAQLNWALLVSRYGGDAAFATGEGTFT